MKQKSAFIVINEKGLHMRPCTEIVKCASNFKANIELTHHALTVNAKSLLGIMMLSAAKGAKIQIEAEGEDAEDAIEALVELAENKFNGEY